CSDAPTLNSEMLDYLSLTTEAGALKENMKKNRYKDILPYDQSRVVLSLLTSDSDYINASFIQGATSDCRYIACQGPLGSTLTDFWRMIWENNVKVIVMACREIEMGKKKCECYWSPLHQSASFGPFTVCNDSRSVTQYQFLSWPDHDVPFEASGVLDLLERVRESRGADTSPLLVHCSAGCGRTGVICALDYIHDLLVNEHSDFSIMQIVKEIRRQRPSAVQTKVGPAPQSRLSTHDWLRLDERGRLGNDSAQMTPPPSHHYDNDPSRASAAPVYSAVKPRAKPHGSPLSATPLYDMPANHRLGDSGEHHLSPGKEERRRGGQEGSGGLSLTDDDYEDFCPSAPDASGRGSPGGIGFNCRIQKPRGPRDPPADWRDELV
uniref:protein-tyrosine-phosphatase n=1 Tax=Cyclopterus lumpus TaxID=8103 RepID=A0A8C2WBD8_CYCLU